MPMPTSASPLDRARFKAYRRLLPLLFICYVIAYVDRVNVGFAKLNMQKDLTPYGFGEALFGFGMGIFFVGYLLLEIPGTLLVEHWSARKWISRIMVSWGFIAGMTAFVHYRVAGITPAVEWLIGALHLNVTPAEFQFCAVRFLLGLAEAGFFPGVIVYLTHWFPSRDRTRALALFFIGTPIAQMIGPPISAMLMSIGTKEVVSVLGVPVVVREHPPVLGLVGWQWVFIAWGIPAVVLGVIVLFYLTDRPRQARWLSDEERDALEAELARERAAHKAHAGHMTVGQALANPKVLLLAAAYFFVVTGNYGVELYMASILEGWYKLKVASVAALIVIPPIGSLLGQVFIGWNSDRTGERRWHATLPILAGAVALALVPYSRGSIPLTVALFTLAMTGLKAYLPAFWALPSLLMTSSAAAASIGLINSFGNLGGWVGPSAVGGLKQYYDKHFKGDAGYNNGLWFLAGSMVVSVVIILSLGIGHRRAAKASPGATPDPLAEPVPGDGVAEPV